MIRFIFFFCLLILFSSPAWAANGDEYFHYSCDPQRGVGVTYRTLTIKEDAKAPNTWPLDALEDSGKGIGKHIIKRCKTNSGITFKTDMTAKPYNFSHEDGQCTGAWYAYLTITTDRDNPDGNNVYFDSKLEQANWCLHKDSVPIIEEVRVNHGLIYVDKVTHDIERKTKSGK